MITTTFIFGAEAVRHFDETGEVPGETDFDYFGCLIVPKEFPSKEIFDAYIAALEDSDGLTGYRVVNTEHSPNSDMVPLCKEGKRLWAFIFPSDMDRDASNSEIIVAFESESNRDRQWPVEKLTPDEFACQINDEMFADCDYWVRFIEL